MPIDFRKLISDAAKGTSDFFDRTGKSIASALDQNGDGKLDLSDIHVVSDRINAAREAAQRKADLERLKPLFSEDFERAEFVMPKMICVNDIDKVHAENAVCNVVTDYEILHGVSFLSCGRGDCGSPAGRGSFMPPVLPASGCR